MTTSREGRALKRRARTIEMRARVEQIRAKMENWFDTNGVKKHRRSRAAPTVVDRSSDDQLPLNFDGA